MDIFCDIRAGFASRQRAVLYTRDSKRARFFSQPFEGRGSSDGFAGSVFESIEDVEGGYATESEIQAVADAEIGLRFQCCDGGGIVDGDLDARVRRVERADAAVTIAYPAEVDG